MLKNRMTCGKYPATDGERILICSGLTTAGLLGGLTPCRSPEDSLMLDGTLLWRGAFSNLQTIGNVVSRIVCDYTAGSPDGFAFA